MSRFKYVLFSIITFGLSITSVSAVCSYEERAELNNQIGNIEASYEVVEIELDPSEYDPPDTVVGTDEEDTYVQVIDALQVNILNLTEDLYAIVTNNYDESQVRYNYSDTDNGNITFLWETIDELVTFTIEIYSSSNTNCADTLLRTIRLSLPRYNEYSNYGMCDNLPDYYLCQRYVFFEPVTFSYFSQSVLAQLEEIQNEEEEGTGEADTWYESVFNFLDEHKVPFIIGGVTLLIIAGVIVVIVVRKRRRSIIWKK